MCAVSSNTVLAMHTSQPACTKTHTAPHTRCASHVASALWELNGCGGDVVPWRRAGQAWRGGGRARGVCSDGGRLQRPRPPHGPGHRSWTHLPPALTSTHTPWMQPTHLQQPVTVLTPAVAIFPLGVGMGTWGQVWRRRSCPCPRIRCASHPLPTPPGGHTGGRVAACSSITCR